MASQEDPISIEEYLLDYERPYLYPKQLAAIFDERRYSFIEASAQPLDCMVQTPSGQRSFGSLCVGDEIFTRDGSVTTVVGVYPKGVQPVYLLTFSDGVSTRTSGDHLWEVDHYRDGVKVVTTDKLRSLTKGGRKLLRFPIAGPVEYPCRPVRIDPWLLGVLIGDGTLCGNALGFSSADQEIVDRVKRAIPAGYSVKKGGKYNYRIVANVRGAGYENPSIRFKADGYEVSVAKRYVGRRSTLAEAESLHAEAMEKTYGDDVPEFNLRRELAALGLLGLKHNEKFVPDLYLRNSPHVRAEILRGIMDTDGSGSSGNAAVIEQTSERLSKNIEELVRSLGGVCRTTIAPARRAEWKISYRTNIKHFNAGSLFWLKRKSERVPVSFNVVRKLVSIERIDDAQVQCIAVDHSSQLYLTDDFIVTHNTKAGKTSGCVVWIFEQALHGQEGWNYWWVAPVSGQADIAFRRCLRAIPHDLRNENQTLKTITLINGAVIWFKSADKPDSLYGEDVFAAVMDEASRTKEDAWYAVRSTLTATRGPIRIIGNVRGRRNWFYQLARKAERGEDSNFGYHKITAIDAIAAHVLEKDEVDDARKVLPEAVFKELYLAEPSDDQGNPFGLKAIEACVKPMIKTTAVAAGWDFAKKQDWSVGVGLDQHGQLAKFDRFRLGWEYTYPRVHAFTGSTPALCDATGVGDPVVERLQKKAGTKFEGFVFSQGSKQQLMEGLAIAIQSGEVTFPDAPEGALAPDHPGNIRRELESFEYEYTRTGVRYTAPAGFHDDCVMALALAVMHKTHARLPMKISKALRARVAGMGRRR